MADPVDIRVMVPRVRRALEGAGAPEVLSEDAVNDLTADAIAEVILYTGGVFGKQLLVTGDDQGVPDEYATNEALTLREQAVIATQAALNYFFQKFSAMKTTERIADEAQTWEYTLSANLLNEQLKLLIGERDRALEAMERDGAPAGRLRELPRRPRLPRQPDGRAVGPRLRHRRPGGLPVRALLRMSGVTPDHAGFRDAQRRLRQAFSEPVRFLAPAVDAYPPDTRLDHEIGMPWDPTIEPIRDQPSTEVYCDAAQRTAIEGAVDFSAFGIPSRRTSRSSPT